MNLSDIITKCYILALIIRDDGERLLLGDGIYEFKSSLQHFAPNIYQNDVVELQGTDGQLLAGQVRRSATQAFDGYIADGTIGKTDTEQSRRRFLGFFRKKHHYKVVYIMPDGTAVQRDRGYIVDAPAVQELYQRFPEYHIGLNFEDPNYYEYSENDEGEEIYTHIQAIALFRELEAGLVWDAFGAVSDDIAWIEYMTKNSTDGYILIGNGLPVEAPLSLTHLYGNAEQNGTPTPDAPIPVNVVSGAQTVKITGKNWWGGLPTTYSTTSSGIDFTTYPGGSVSASGTSTAVAASCSQTPAQQNGLYVVIPKGTYTLSGTNPDMPLQLFDLYSGTILAYTGSPTFTVNGTTTVFIRVRFASGITIDGTTKIQLERGNTATDFEPYQSQSQVINLGGSNIFDISSATMANIYMNTNGWTSASNDWIGTDSYIEVEPNTTYTLSSSATAGTQVAINQYTSQSRSSFISPRIDTATFTTSATAKYISFSIKDPNATNIMLNKGSTAQPYVPYTTYAYELAKIGTYQDYIWNDSGTWKIHKAVGKFTLDGTQSSTSYIARTNTFRAIFQSGITGLGSGNTDNRLSKSERFTDDTGIWGNDREGFYIDNANVVVSANIATVGNTITSMRTWLASNPTKFYTPLLTPTDTEITDSELIAQLNHIYELYQGTNNLWLIGTGAQGEMTVRFGVAYDDDGYHWSEELGSPDNIISNDGIDSVRPIWIINGPATNPTLTNITTAQTIAWNGTVPADATLTIDMERQTATLNGANVYAQIEGDWLELAVGPNKLQYVASGGAAADSTLEWNGVAG